MKKIVALLLTLLLCGSLFACVAVQNAQDAFFQSEAGSMIGKTYEEVEAAFGPLSVVYLEKDRPAAYIFNNSTVSFHFHAPLVQKRWAALLTDKVGFIPSSIALRDIQPTDKCIGVSGRIRDFGIADSDVNELSASLQTLRPEPEETKTNTIYTLTTPDQNYEVRVFCAKGETAVTPNHQIQVMLTKLTPAADPSVTEFTFGGVTIPAPWGLDGHSDADALLHAITDAFLGALALGDIGQMFPDHDPKYLGADSAALLRAVLASPAFRDWELCNLDCTVFAEAPKLAPHRDAIRQSIARILGTPVELVSVKAKTNERQDSVGQGRAIAASATVLLKRRGS